MMGKVEVWECDHEWCDKVADKNSARSEGWVTAEGRLTPAGFNVQTAFCCAMHLYQTLRNHWAASSDDEQADAPLTPDDLAREPKQ